MQCLLKHSPSTVTTPGQQYLFFIIPVWIWLLIRAVLLLENKSLKSEFPKKNCIFTQEFLFYCIHVYVSTYIQCDMPPSGIMIMCNVWLQLALLTQWWNIFSISSLTSQNFLSQFLSIFDPSVTCYLTHQKTDKDIQVLVTLRKEKAKYCNIS